MTATGQLFPSEVPTFFSGGQMDESTFKFVTRTLRRWPSRLALIHKRTRLYCGQCQELRRVVDFFQGPQVAVLDCRHRRPIAYRTDSEITAYRVATIERHKQEM